MFINNIFSEMPSNVEIKAWLRDLDHVSKRARELSGSDGTVIRQHDTFFHVSNEGRLKLRDFLVSLLTESD